MKKVFYTITVVLLIMGLGGCSQKNATSNSLSSDPYIQDKLSKSIVELADQLFESTRIEAKDKVAITAFVDLHKLNKTTHFGRKLSESMFNELHTRGFNVVDIRGTNTIRINADGEFFITRDIKLLSDKKIQSTYVLVATYSKFGDGILLNARIIDNKYGDVISTARTIVDIASCDVYENCNKVTHEKQTEQAIMTDKRIIGLSDAGCSEVTCPTNCIGEECYEGLNQKPYVPQFKSCNFCE